MADNAEPGAGDKKQFREIHQILARYGYEVGMVAAEGGNSFGVLTAKYLGRLKRECGLMLAVCTKTYGEVTGSEYSSQAELKFAQTYGKTVRVFPLRVRVLPLRVDTYPPEPPGGRVIPMTETMLVKVLWTWFSALTKSTWIAGASLQWRLPLTSRTACTSADVFS